VTTVTASCAGGVCRIAAGCFLMGSPPTDSCRDGDEAQHWVLLTHDFEIGAHEVTQAEFQAAAGYAPATFSGCGADCPVETVSWHESAAFANARSVGAGLTPCYDCTGAGPAVTCTTAAAFSATGADIYSCPGYRLPTEAEFEYAYRAGTTTSYYNGDATHCYDADPVAAPIAWDCFNAGGAPHPVGGKLLNAFGLYDMAGNIEEWVHDGYAPYPDGPVIDPVLPLTDDTYHSGRGGSWYVYPRDVRAADRNKFAGAEAVSFRGLRLVRTVTFH